MFLPIGDTPNPSRFTPLVTYGLIAANVLVYILISIPMSAMEPSVSDLELANYPREFLVHATNAYDLFVYDHGYKPGAPDLLDLFTSMFLHGGFMHLAGNMLFLWIFGDNVEHRVGRARFLVIYLATGVAATLAFAVFADRPFTPLVGASGAISGALGLYFVMFPRNRVKVLIIFFPFYFNVILLPVRLVLGFYIVVQNLLPFLIQSQSSVAYGAHIGGFFAGAAIAWFGERADWNFSPRPATRETVRLKAVRNVAVPDDDAGTRAMDDPLRELKAGLATDDDQRIGAAFLQTSRQRLLDLTPNESATLSAWLMDSGHPMAATDLLRRAVAARRTGPEDEHATLLLALGLARLQQGQVARAYQHFLDVLDLDAEEDTRADAKRALDTIDLYRPRRG